MSIFNNLTSLTGNALSGNLANLIEQAKKAIADGHAAESPIGKLVSEKVLSMIPAGSGAMVDRIDALIPDNLEVSLGITPEIKAFIKKAVSIHQIAPAAQ